MENSNKPSSSNMKDVAQSPKKKNLAKNSTKKMSPLMKAAKIPVKMQKSKKMSPLSKKSTTLGSLKKKGMGEVMKKSLATNTKKSPLKVKAAKKKLTTTSEEGMKTRASSNRASLDSLMAGFQTEGRAKTALGMPLKDFSESAVALLMSNYKVENEKVLSTTALAMSSGASKSKDKTLSSLERYQQFFTEEKTSSLLSPKGSRLLGHAEDLNVEANAALQALLLVSAMNLTGKKPAGSSMKLATRKSIGLSKIDTKKRLLLIATMAEILHQKSNTFEDKKLSAQLAKIYKDLNKMVADY